MSLTHALRQSSAATAPDRRHLAVTKLMLTNFRSYTHAELSVSGRPVVLAGPNGAGKTNLLDAISLLSPGRGMRGALLAEHIRKAPQTTQNDVLWAVAASVLHSTKHLKVLVAHRPGFVQPVVLARMAATLDNLTGGGRIAIHFITGGDEADQRREGDFVPHDVRYRRTQEVMSIARRIWSDSPTAAGPP